MKWGMGAWKIMSNETGKSIDKLFDGLDEYEFAALITYAGLKYAALAMNLEVPNNIYQVQQWLDDGNADLFSKIGRAFADSKFMGKTMREYIAAMEEEAGDKKKAEKVKRSLRT